MKERKKKVGERGRETVLRRLKLEPIRKAFVNNLKTFVVHLGTKVETFFVPSTMCATWWMDM